jgi:hypothetical protein
VAHGFPNGATGGELSLKLGFADAAEKEAITKEILSLILGGNYDFQAGVLHGVWRWLRWRTYRNPAERLEKSAKKSSVILADFG